MGLCDESATETVKDASGRRTHLRGECECIDLIERYDRHAFLELAVLQKILSDMFILDHDIVQFAACSDLKRCCLIRVFGRDRSQGGNETFDFAAVEIGVG